MQRNFAVFKEEISRIRCIVSRFNKWGWIFFLLKYEIRITLIYTCTSLKFCESFKDKFNSVLVLNMLHCYCQNKTDVEAANNCTISKMYSKELNEAIASLQVATIFFLNIYNYLREHLSGSVTSPLCVSYISISINTQVSENLLLGSLRQIFIRVCSIEMIMCTTHIFNNIWKSVFMSLIIHYISSTSGASRDLPISVPVWTLRLKFV